MHIQYCLQIHRTTFCAASKVCHVILDHWASIPPVAYIQLLFSQQIYTESMFDLYSYLFRGQ